MINGEAWDSSGVARIIALDRALAKFRPAKCQPSGTHAEQSTKIAAAVAIEGVGKAWSAGRSPFYEYNNLTCRIY